MGLPLRADARRTSRRTPYTPPGTVRIRRWARSSSTPLLIRPPERRQPPEVGTLCGSGASPLSETLSRKDQDKRTFSPRDFQFRASPSFRQSSRQSFRQRKENQSHPPSRKCPNSRIGLSAVSQTGQRRDAPRTCRMTFSVPFGNRSSGRGQS